VRQVFASPDGTLAVFGVCPKLIQIKRFDEATASALRGI